MGSTKSSPSRDRKAKIEAARKSSGGGANKVVVAAVVVIVAIIAVVGGVIWSSRATDAGSGGTALPKGVTAMGEGYRAFADVTAKEGAPRVDVYEDFQCPACKQFEQLTGSTITSLAKEGRIVLVYHVKNFLDDNLRNDSSTRAGNAAFCAADAGRFQEFHDQVFPGQPAQEGTGFTDADLRGFAEAAGLTGDALSTWETCLEDGRYDAYVDSVEKKSFDDGVRGTPTVRIDGVDQELGAIASPEGFTAAVEAATK
jgi:protein-disulfide isomerase